VVNSDAFTDGWFFKMQPHDLGELDELMSADEYLAFCDDED
jgi:glycine cleavage system H protein